MNIPKKFLEFPDYYLPNKEARKSVWTEAISSFENMLHEYVGVCVVEGPKGSGKTLFLGEIISTILELKPRNIRFIDLSAKDKSTCYEDSFIYNKLNSFGYCPIFKIFLGIIAGLVVAFPILIVVVAEYFISKKIPPKLLTLPILLFFVGATILISLAYISKRLFQSVLKIISGKKLIQDNKQSWYINKILEKNQNKILILLIDDLEFLHVNTGNFMISLFEEAKIRKQKLFMIASFSSDSDISEEYRKEIRRIYGWHDSMCKLVTLTALERHYIKSIIKRFFHKIEDRYDYPDIGFYNEILRRSGENLSRFCHIILPQIKQDYITEDGKLKEGFSGIRRLRCDPSWLKEEYSNLDQDEKMILAFIILTEPIERQDFLCISPKVLGKYVVEQDKIKEVITKKSAFKKQWLYEKGKKIYLRDPLIIDMVDEDLKQELVKELAIYFCRQSKKDDSYKLKAAEYLSNCESSIEIAREGFLILKEVGVSLLQEDNFWLAHRYLIKSNEFGLYLLRSNSQDREIGVTILRENIAKVYEYLGQVKSFIGNSVHDPLIYWEKAIENYQNLITNIQPSKKKKHKKKQEGKIKVWESKSFQLKANVAFVYLLSGKWYKDPYPKESRFLEESVKLISDNYRRDPQTFFGSYSKIQIIHLLKNKSEKIGLGLLQQDGVDPFWYHLQKELEQLEKSYKLQEIESKLTFVDLYYHLCSVYLQTKNYDNFLHMFIQAHNILESLKSAQLLSIIGKGMLAFHKARMIQLLIDYLVYRYKEFLETSLKASSEKEKFSCLDKILSCITEIKNCIGLPQNSNTEALFKKLDDITDVKAKGYWLDDKFRQRCQERKDRFSFDDFQILRKDFLEEKGIFPNLIQIGFEMSGELYKIALSIFNTFQYSIGKLEVYFHYGNHEIAYQEANSNGCIYHMPEILWRLGSIYEGKIPKRSYNLLRKCLDTMDKMNYPLGDKLDICATLSMLHVNYPPLTVFTKEGINYSGKAKRYLSQIINDKEQIKSHPIFADMCWCSAELLRRQDDIHAAKDELEQVNKDALNFKRKMDFFYLEAGFLEYEDTLKAYQKHKEIITLLDKDLKILLQKKDVKIEVMNSVIELPVSKKDKEISYGLLIMKLRSEYDLLKMLWYDLMKTNFDEEKIDQETADWYSHLSYDYDFYLRGHEDRLTLSLFEKRTLAECGQLMGIVELSIKENEKAHGHLQDAFNFYISYNDVLSAAEIAPILKESMIKTGKKHLINIFDTNIKETLMRFQEEEIGENIEELFAIGQSLVSLFIESEKVKDRNKQDILIEAYRFSDSENKERCNMMIMKLKEVKINYIDPKEEDILILRALVKMYRMTEKTEELIKIQSELERTIKRATAQVYFTLVKYFLEQKDESGVEWAYKHIQKQENLDITEEAKQLLEKN